MEKTVRQYVKEFVKDKVLHRRVVSILCVLSVMVAVGVFWQMRFVGITKTAEACCGNIEHKHDETCGITQTLICSMDESIAQTELICTLQEHTHTDACYEQVTTLVCMQTDELHEHSEECYSTDQILTCSVEEHVHGEDCWSQPEAEHVHTDECYEITYECGLPEHEHTASCYMDLDADVETAADWEATLPSQLSGIWTEDLVAVAKSQLGYKASARNFILAEDGESELGYTRYGAWYGNPYGHWDAMFVSFCLSYAQIPRNQFPLSSGSTAFAAQLKEMGLYIESEPQAGDVVLFNIEGSEDHIGIVTAVNAGTIYTVEGDVDGVVAESSYSCGDGRIAGYGRYHQAQEEPQAEERVLTYTGEDYSVSALIRSEAKVPETTGLAVREIVSGTEEYDGYYAQTLAAMQLEIAPVFCRLFDVSFINNGEVIEPLAPVNVTITYAMTLPLVEENKCTVVNFAENGLEISDAQVKATSNGDAVIFAQDSLSVIGNIIEGTMSLTPGSPYIFYTADGNALGVMQNSTDYSVTLVPITEGDNGGIAPASADAKAEDIVWYYENGGLVSAATRNGYGVGKYLDLVSSSPQLVGDGTAHYKSTVGLTSNVNVLSSHVINDTVKLSNVYSTEYSPFILAYENGAFKSGTAFDDAELYLLMASVADVKDYTGEPGNLEIQDDICYSGCIMPKWTITQPGSVLTYVWEKSFDDGNTWSQVERCNVMGEYYNIAEDGSWLNVALDNGAEMQYRVSLVAVDGSTLLTPYVSETYRIAYCDELKNGDFETPMVHDGNRQSLAANDIFGMAWKTASGGQVEYVRVEASDLQSISEAAYSGEQYADLCAASAGVLYQDVLTVPGSTMYWKLAHRARNTSELNGATDTMYVVIMSAKLAEQYDVSMQNVVSDIIANPSAYPGAFVRAITSDNTAWHTYSDQYNVPEGQYLSRCFIAAGYTASDDTGNHVDKVSFSTTLPQPDSDKLSIVIQTTLTGLSREQVVIAMERLAFCIYDEQNSAHLADIDGARFGRLTDNADGSFTASYTVQNLNTGSYRIMEDTSNSIAEVAGYTRETTADSVLKLVNGYYDNGYYCLDISANAGQTATVEFENSYVRLPVDVTLQMTDDDGVMLTAEFLLDANESEAWNTAKNVTTYDGQAVMPSLVSDTLYCLTETKAPEGYAALTEPLHFMISNDEVVFCDTEGEEAETPDMVSIDATTITVLNSVNYVLPETGGTGSAVFVIAGLLLITVPLMFECILRHKRERRFNM